MTNHIIAKRYARALLETARESGKQKEYGQQLDLVRATLDKISELKQVLSNPAIGKNERDEVWREVLNHIELDQIVKNFLMLLMDRGRLIYIDQIADYYNELLDEQQGITRATVRSVAELNDIEIKNLTERLEALVGKKIILEVKGDPSLIGGMVAQIGDLVLDGSLKNELARLKDSLTRGD